MNATATASAVKTVNIDGREVPINGERNLLELIRKADIDLPTFCYHSDLSVYGACRLCLVEIAGRGIQGACSTPPEPGLKIRTQTEEIREIRKIAIELLLANHERECTTCAKSAACQLQDVARKLGIQKVRFKPVHEPEPVDRSSLSLVRDPNKCVLCGDCVRFCSEIQGIGAIDFAHRGHEAAVLPAFGRELGAGECVNCGQCAAVCPTGALTPRWETEEVWKALNDPRKTVVVQVAPAVRVAIGELFGLPPGESSRGQMVAALKRLGFNKVYDTSFSADLTVVEEANEFLNRKTKGGKLPLFTSCCPGWVKFAEQYFPELLPNLSTCKSPQQMLGALAKELLPAELGVKKEDLVMVAIMPCTAKKFEAKRPEFAAEGIAEVDHVLTTQELARMIEEAGLRFSRLQPESFDMPMGFKTGAGVIFGNSGGVSEAVLRYAAEKVTGQKLTNPDFPAVRGENGLRIVEVPVDGVRLKLGIVHGLKNARTLAEKARRGNCDLDLIEVRACPGGCIGGAGQPVSRDPEIRRLRTKGLYDVDKNMELHKSQENHFVTECYQKHLGEIGGRNAHRLLHTHYHNRRRITDEDIALGEGPGADKLKVKVCTGTNCFLKGSQAILHDLLEHVQQENLRERVDICASFCFEKCDQGPTVSVDGSQIQRCTSVEAKAEVARKLKNK
ncbi:MAG TPA: [FeFe] hydrogenase, group A [Candidatus Acidoferrales bacterium]|nr:[FeFe] hydrogenase, group A [Candidatus Acidoferrales bacterium]